MVQSRVQYGPRWERTDALLQRSRRFSRASASPKPIARLHQAREVHRYIESDIVGHGSLPPDACIATIKLYPSRAESSVIGSRDYRHVL
jgi:hypothetical protein